MQAMQPDPVGPPVDASPARQPATIALKGRFGTVERLDVARHGESLWQALEGHDRLWTYMFHGPFADRAAFAAWLVSARCSPIRSTTPSSTDPAAPAGWRR